MSFQQVAAPPPQPGPVDLDRVEAEAGQFAADGWVAGNVPGLIAELRAARSVVIEAWDALDCLHPEDAVVLRDRIAAYDRAVNQP